MELLKDLKQMVKLSMICEDTYKMIKEDIKDQKFIDEYDVHMYLDDLLYDTMVLSTNYNELNDEMNVLINDLHFIIIMIEKEEVL